MKNAKGKDIVSGIKDVTPVCIGVIPVAMSFALLAMQNGMTAFEVMLMSTIVFAGASQLMAVGMLGAGASAVAILLSTFLVNLRHIVMSTHAMNKLQDVKLPARLGMAFMLCDEGFALFAMAPQEKQTPWYYLGLGGSIYVVWVLATLMGVLFSNFLPEIVSKSMGIAFYATFIAVLLPGLRKNWRLVLIALLTVGLNALFRLFMPVGLPVVCAVLVGSAIGTLIYKEDEEQAEGKNT